MIVSPINRESEGFIENHILKKEMKYVSAGTFATKDLIFGEPKRGCAFGWTKV